MKKMCNNCRYFDQFGDSSKYGTCTETSFVMSKEGVCKNHKKIKISLKQYINFIVK